MAQEYHSNEFGVTLPQRPWSLSTTPIITGMALASVSRIGGMINDSWDVRNHLPEPFDIPDHVGNAAVTFLLMDKVITGIHGKEPQALTEDERHRILRRTAVAVGTLSIAANVVGEVIGYGPGSTPDAVDFAYGLMGGVLAYYAKKPGYVPSETVNAIARTTPPNDSSMKVIRYAIQKRMALQGKKMAATEQDSDTKQSPSVIKPVGNLQKRDKNRAKMQKESRKRNRNR